MSLFGEPDLTSAMDDLGAIVAYIGPRGLRFELSHEGSSWSWVARLRDADGRVVVSARMRAPAECVCLLADAIRTDRVTDSIPKLTIPSTAPSDS